MAKGWAGIVQDFRIPSRPGSSRKNIEVRCPMCFDDPSMHLGLKIESAQYGCWRDASHKGGGYSSVKRLIGLLLQVTPEKAGAIAESYFDSKEWIGDHSSEAPRDRTKFVIKPPEFLPFTFKAPEEGKFLQYLVDRGFDAKQIVNRYNLHYSLYGPYNNRIIIPIVIRNMWRSWTARTIEPGNRTRYKAAGELDGALEPNEFLLDHENLSGGKILVIQEGAFDAFRVASCLIPGVQATCLFGQKLSAPQMAAIIELSPFYKRVVFAGDPKSQRTAIGMVDRLGYFVQNCTYLGADDKLDRGSRTTDSVSKELKSYIQSME